MYALLIIIGNFVAALLLWQIFIKIVILLLGKNLNMIP